MKGNSALIITNIILLSCIVVGLIIFMIYGMSGKISFFGKNVKLVDEIKYNDININSVKVDVKSYDIEVTSSDTNEIAIEIYGNEKTKKNTEITNSNGVLRINQKRSIICFGFCYTSNIVIKLPKSYQGKFDINNVSGDIISRIDFLENDNSITSTSGDIELPTITSGTIKSVSGDIKISYLKTGKVKTTSGDIEITSFENGEITSISGEIEIDNFIGSGSIETTSGDIRLNKFEILGNTTINSTSGDIRVNLLNEAYITADTISGDKDIKNSRGEYDLKLKTISGDIDVR